MKKVTSWKLVLGGSASGYDRLMGMFVSVKFGMLSFDERGGEGVAKLPGAPHPVSRP